MALPLKINVQSNLGGSTYFMSRKIIGVRKSSVKFVDKLTGDAFVDCEIRQEEERDFMPLQAPYVFMTQNMDWDESLSSAAMKVLFHLIRTMKPGGEIHRSRQGIAKTMGMKRDTVGRAIRELVSAGIIHTKEVGFKIDETKIYIKPRKISTGKQAVLQIVSNGN